MATREEIAQIKAQQAEDQKAKDDAAAAENGNADGAADESKDDNADVDETHDGADKNKDSDIDYEAELKLEIERAGQATKDAADAAFKLREDRRKLKEGTNADDVNAADKDEDDTDTEKPLTRAELQAVLEADRQKTRKEMQAQQITEKVKSLSRSEAEAKLIIEIHKNRTFPVGMPLDEQLEEAYAIANRKNLLARNAELQRAIRGKNNVATGASETFRDSAGASEPRSANSADVQTLKAQGFTWDGTMKTYKKVLKSGRVITFNPPAKR